MDNSMVDCERRKNGMKDKLQIYDLLQSRITLPSHIKDLFYFLLQLFTQSVSLFYTFL